MKREVTILATVLLGCSMTSCKSIESTFFSRNEMNTGWQKVEHLKGVPITLKVPTHLKVEVIEKHYLTTSTIGGVSQVTHLKVPVPMREVRHDFIRTEKMFTVDFKRPAAGRMDLTLEMNDEQYFKKIEHEVEDETINAISNLVQSVGSQFRPAAGGEDVEKNVKEVESVVAFKVFEIDAPDFELQLSEFLQCHLNQSHDAWVAPPGVDAIRRVPLENGHVPEDVLCPEGCPPASPLLSLPRLAPAAEG